MPRYVMFSAPTPRQALAKRESTAQMILAVTCCQTMENMRQAFTTLQEQFKPLGYDFTFEHDRSDCGTEHNVRLVLKRCIRDIVGDENHAPSLTELRKDLNALSLTMRNQLLSALESYNFLPENAPMLRSH